MTLTQTSSITREADYMTGANDISRSRLWTSRVLSGLVTAFLAMDGVMKLAKPAFVVQATVQLGYPESTIVGIGAALLVCTLLYVVPRTAVLGAALLTGYLGGAVASNVRAATPLFNVVFPILLGVLIWSSLWLRDSRVRNLLPVIR
jgi:uncharacterized membrane protein YsdA (DUF1294 family)